MGLLIDIINDRTRDKYCQNALDLQNNVVQPITKREYLVPNNAKSSATYFWQNVLLIRPANDGHTFPSTFIPSNKQNIVVRARFSNHPSGPLENWTKYEAMGSPNRRVDIYFYSADDSDNPNGDVETHIISNKHLYSESDVKLLQQALAHFFASGDFKNPFNTDGNNNQQDIVSTHGNNQENINCNRNINNKSLTESDLRRIVRESVNKLLAECIQVGRNHTL